MKLLALHLPAFHQIPENDKWWGEGFTEWDNVRGAKPLYKKHKQPLKPLNDNYYNLSNPQDILAQIKLAKKYGISGFVFYHYWFSENRMIFEKPVELLRDRIKEEIEYCFCWANDSWITTWHGKDPKELILQTYGDKHEWIAHIKYLETFFRDERYIKIENRPVLFFYKPNDIAQYSKMIACWNDYLSTKGIAPIYAVEFISSKNQELSSNSSDAVMEFEPLYSTYFDINIFNKAKRAFCKALKITDFQRYSVLWNCILSRKRIYSDKSIIKSCFCAWDNSPRKEKSGMIVTGADSEKFENYLRELIYSKRRNTRNDYLVINAWNEWSEGAFLEPSDAYGYKYLEAVKNSLQNPISKSDIK